MKPTLAIFGLLALTLTANASFASGENTKTAEKKIVLSGSAKFDAKEMAAKFYKEIVQKDAATKAKRDRLAKKLEADGYHVSEAKYAMVESMVITNDFHVAVGDIQAHACAVKDDLITYQTDEILLGEQVQFKRSSAALLMARVTVNYSACMGGDEEAIGQKALGKQIVHMIFDGFVDKKTVETITMGSHY